MDEGDEREKARVAVLELIAKAAERAAEQGGNTSAQAGVALALAEAYAWATRPDQPHG